MKSIFVVQRSRSKFFLMGLDQSQENSIKLMEEDGGGRCLYGEKNEKELMEISRPKLLELFTNSRKLYE